jgi:hypothetical protein
VYTCIFQSDFGVDFHFDVSTPSPAWISDQEYNNVPDRPRRGPNGFIPSADKTFLMDMGYSHDEAQNALEASNFNLEAAITMLVEQ